MNKFEEFFWNSEKKTSIDKWHHYFKIYDRHFNKFIGKNPVILEIGVYKGGSLEMWNYYFDKKCSLYAVDCNSDCLNIPYVRETSNIHIEIGDQSDRDFWRSFLKDKPKFDIIIDDGGHLMNQQIITYEEVYNHISDNGVYLCEDTHTSYWEGYGGGLQRKGTFIEYTKNFIDMINSYHIQEKLNDEKKSIFRNFRTTTNSIHYYDSIVILEKSLDLTIPVGSLR